MALIKGMTITLYEKRQIGVDGFGRPEYDIEPVSVNNVLVSPVEDSEVLETLNLTGRKVVYQLAIPKGDQHEWVDREVGFWGRRFRVVREPAQGMDEMIPLEWNKKVKVEAINGKKTDR